MNALLALLALAAPQEGEAGSGLRAGDYGGRDFLSEGGDFPLRWRSVPRSGRAYASG